MFKNGMRPVHPGEILLEDYIKPLGISVRALSLALHVIKQLFFCKFRELVLRCCALAANQGVMFR